eukprot:CAMPEP_0194049028 /NCGR_PEP_ID=MMETSP0009_2-20130614/29408_1 /TAXON_ID=210454 /ORGANISM="Grammatophora oceanica, Strain CCMP 410" /LENGTH=254 /DNA_ID=CAMNT_0038695081 /DNA_START=92 /DNA_END=856 /DNA_ORIENTATION=+
MKRSYDEIVVPPSTDLRPATLNDDDIGCSTSTTMAGLMSSNGHHQKQEESPTRRRKRRRRQEERVVRFVGEQGNEKRNIDVDDNTWLSAEDYEQIRQGVLQDIRDVANSPLQPSQTLLNETMYSIHDNNDNDDRDPSSSQQQQVLDTAKAMMLESFTIWAQYIDPGRGLESIINLKLGLTRRKHRQDAIRALLALQTISRERENKKTDGDIEEEEAGQMMVLLLSAVSQKYSALSNQHALLMGIADETAARTPV